MRHTEACDRWAASQPDLDGCICNAGKRKPARLCLTPGCTTRIYHSHHLLRGYCARDYCQAWADAQAKAPTHHEALTGCVGVGDGRHARPHPDRGQCCDQPPVTYRFVPEPVLERLVDGLGWHVTELGLASERCTADDAIRAEVS